MPGRLRAIDLLRSCYHLGQPHVGADWQRHEVVALVVTGVFLCCAALLVGGVVIVALLAVGRLVIRAGLIVSRSEEHTSELQSRGHLVCRLLLEKKKD